MKKIHINQYTLSMGKLIDVNDHSIYYENHHPSSINIPLNKLLMNHKELLNKSLPYYITCLKGVKSRRAVNILEFYGYNVTHVFNE